MLFEVYASDYYPDSFGVFTPADAVARWAKTDIVWLGNEYERRIVSHSTFSQFISGQFNNGTLTIENADRYLAEFVDAHVVDGMRLVVRYINIDLSATLADSVVCFVGRLQPPDNSELDREQGDLTAREELASLDIQTPKRTVSPQDPNGRSPNDPLYEGFSFNARPSTVKYNVQTTTTRFKIFSSTKNEIKYNQWSSVTETDNAVVPLILGRTQRDGLAVFWVDIGFYVVGIWVFAGMKVTSITNFQLPDSNYIFYGIWSNPVLQQAHVHLGDPGGTGTNATPDTIENNYQQNTALLSRSAYTGFAIGGPETATQPFANPQMDSVPTLVAIVRGECDLPNGGGVFNLKGFSDSPVYNARFVLTSQDFFGLDPRLIYDGELPSVHGERQRPVVDKSNGEFLALMSSDASAVTDGRLTRLNSTGLIDSRYFRHLLDGTYPDPLVTSRSDIYAVQPGGVNASGGDQQLTNGAGLAGQTVVTSAWKYYYIDTPIGASQLVVTATGSGDGTSFLRLGSKPTLTSYDTFAYTASPQTMTITNPTAGRWWIGIAGFQPGGTPTAGLSYSIIAIVTGGAAGAVLPIRPALRTAYTTNIALTDTSNAIDFLNNVVLAAGRLYRLTDSAGRQRIRAKKASDPAFLITSTSIGATSVLIANVEPWRASNKGYVLIDVGLITSEYRKVTTALYYPTLGNAIPLTVSSPGTSISASGATLSGGSTTVPSSGTVTVGSVGTVGDVLTVNVWNIPIKYTVTSADNVNSIAGMLAASINADPNLRQYVRAVWGGAAVLTIYCTIGNLSFATPLVNSHAAKVDSPVTGPTAASVTSGSLAPGDYYLGYTLIDGSGDETLMSPLTKIAITASHKVSVTSLGTLPTGASEVNWYFSPAPGDDLVQWIATNTGGAFTIDAVADHDADFPPEMNTTGGETIRVMEVFNQFNTRTGSFKWVPSRSKINQITGTFIDAANGFKPTPIIVNDRAHQRAIGQINKQEINLSAVDNFSQASRLCYAALAELRDGGAGAKWATDDAGIVLEIGDVVAVNDYRWNGSAIEAYIVNQPLIIQEVNLSEDFDVSFVGNVYSSALLEGLTGRKPIVLSTTLKYFSEAPAVATNLTLVEDDLVTAIIGDFDFTGSAGSQVAQIFIKGPADSEPSDSTYTLADSVRPDTNLHGHFEIRGLNDGKYWVRVVTKSSFGVSASSGHPVGTIILQPKAPTNLAAVPDPSFNWHISVTSKSRESERPASFIARVRKFSTGALMRDIPMIETSATSFAAMFPDVSADGYTVDNNAYANGAALTNLFTRAAQVITEQGSFVEAIVAHDDATDPTTHSVFAALDLLDPAADWDDPLAPLKYRFVLGSGGNAARTNAVAALEEPDGVGGNTFTSYGLVWLPAKIRIAFVGTQVRFYVDWVNSSSKPIAVGVTPLQFPLKIRLVIGSGNKVLNLRVGGLSDPQTIYSAAQQMKDNSGSVLNDITIESWQVSKTAPDAKGISTPVARFNY